MLFKDAYIGLKVKALTLPGSKTCSPFFPVKGTEGKIIAIDDINQTLLIQWKRGSTSGNDKWYNRPCHVEPLKYYKRTNKRHKKN